MTAVPPDTDALSDPPADDVRPDLNHGTDNFMTGNSRIAKPWKSSVFGNRISMANTASFDPNQNLARTGRRNLTPNNHQISTGGRNFNRKHGRQDHSKRIRAPTGQTVRWESAANNSERCCAKQVRKSGSSSKAGAPDFA
jgi:hypothetical protein